MLKYVVKNLKKLYQIFKFYIKRVMFDVVISFLDELNLDKKLLVQILF